MPEQRMYRITLSQTEFAILSGMFYIGEKLVTHRVNREFNDMWRSVERAITEDPPAFATLEAKILAFAKSAAENMIEDSVKQQLRDKQQNPGASGNGEVTGQ